MTEYTVLCEDKQSACFIRRFLKSRNIEHHKFYEVPVPNGKGCGEQFVREKYPVELKNSRKNKTKLIVCTDADNNTISERIKMLDEECRKQKIYVRNRDDKVTMIIPKRNIETWLEILNGNDKIDETVKLPFKHKADKVRCQKAVESINSFCLNNQKIPENFPESLNFACKEAKNIGF